MSRRTRGSRRAAECPPHPLADVYVLRGMGMVGAVGYHLADIPAARAKIVRHTQADIPGHGLKWLYAKITFGFGEEM